MTELPLKKQRLIDAIRAVNARRIEHGDDISHDNWSPEVHAEIAAALDRLAVYGSLAPGKANHHRLTDYEGSWTAGVVHGWLHEEGWGATLGYPGLAWDLDGPSVKLDLFQSGDLSTSWSELDRFEGEEYVRILVPIETDRDLLIANIYALRRFS